MTKAEKQKFFNKSVRGLAKQGFKRSHDYLQGCRYRGPGGMRCAIGHLIPNERYKECLEGEGADNPAVMKMVGVSHTNKRKEFFCRLQEAHDDSESPNMMQRALKSLAIDLKLDIPECLKEAT